MKENIKEHIKDNALNFFIIVTLVNIAIFVSGNILAPAQRFGYEAFLVPILDGFLGIIPGLVMYSKRELTVKQMIVRNMIQLMSIELIVLLITFGFSGLTAERIPHIVSVVISVAVIFAAVIVIKYFLDLRTARELMDDLKAFQNEN